jgi:septum formation protein
MELILASASPRRAEILAYLGIAFRVCPSEVDETVLPGEHPRSHAERVARGKAEAVSRLYPMEWVLAGDTVVGLEDEILGKPRNSDDAVEILLRLQGKVHQVITALALIRPDLSLTGGDHALAAAPTNGSSGEGGDATLAPALHSGFQVTSVAFRSFDRAFAEGYVRTGEPMDKAGAYGIQGSGAALVTGIVGDYSAVVGLSVPLLLRLLEEAGAPYRFG